MMIGWCKLNDMWFNFAFFLETICCVHMAWYLSIFISNTWAFPSTVTAANTVLEYGAHAISPTCEFTSNINSGFLKWIYLLYNCIFISIQSIIWIRLIYLAPWNWLTLICDPILLWSIPMHKSEKRKLQRDSNKCCWLVYCELHM